MNSGNILYPNVTSIPGQGGVSPSERPEPKKQEGVKSDFDRVFETEHGREVPKDPGALGKGGLTKDLNQLKQPLKFSAHATQRLAERKIALDSAMMAKVSDAIDKAEAKGVEDTLVLTGDAALIVSVKNRTVVTAMDRSQLSGNVFTNIDGAVII